MLLSKIMVGYSEKHTSLIKIACQKKREGFQC